MFQNPGSLHCSKFSFHVIAYTSIEFRFNSIEVECHVSCSLVYIIIVARREVARYYAALEPSTVQCMYIVQYHFTRSSFCSSLHLLLERVYYLPRKRMIHRYVPYHIIIGDTASPCTLRDSKQAIGVGPFILRVWLPMILSGVEIS